MGQQPAVDTSVEYEGHGGEGGSQYGANGSFLFPGEPRTKRGLARPEVARVVVADQMRAPRIGQARLEPFRSSRGVGGGVAEPVKKIAEENDPIGFLPRDEGLDVRQHGLGRLVQVGYDQGLHGHRRECSSVVRQRLSHMLA